jgi:hypothetical protein
MHVLAGENGGFDVGHAGFVGGRTQARADFHGIEFPEFSVVGARGVRVPPCNGFADAGSKWSAGSVVLPGFDEFFDAEGVAALIPRLGLIGPRA